MFFINCKMLSSWTSLCLLLIYLWKVNCNEETNDGTDERQPFWNIAHMVNSILEIDEFLGLGANSIEFDVEFDREGVVRKTRHGIPCNCVRSCDNQEDFVKYIEYMRTITSPDSPKFQSQLVLLFFDCKVNMLTTKARKRAGEDLASKLLEHYWQNGKSKAQAYILISVPSIKHKDFIENFRSKLERENFTPYYSKIGYNFAGNEDLDNIDAVYKSLSINKNIWQGDGKTSCIPRELSRLKECLKRRDTDESFVNKVYWWTVDTDKSIRKLLSLRVDGMVTNFPNRVKAVLSENAFRSTFRLATLDDNPWETHRFRNGSYAYPSISALADENELIYNCEEKKEKACNQTRI